GHIGAAVTDLRLYGLTEELFAADAPLRLAHRQRQARLQHAKQAARALLAADGEPAVLRPARRQAIAAIRRLDRAHLQGIGRVHAAFERELAPAARPAVQAAAASIRRAIASAGAILITGGHVAVLVNRLRLLGGAALFAGKPIVAWSGAAMVASEAIVLFHDQPPQGAANVELFDEGLGLVRGVLPFPHAQSRLHLHDPNRIALISRRFAPLVCVTLDAGAYLHFSAGRLRDHGGGFRLGRQGELSEIAA
ncbi:MAG TPA: hypothetical protein VF315_07725, partial [Steroidobacteraceae bacterium]